MDLAKLQAEIVSEMVPASLVSAADALAIARHADLLLGMEDVLVADFYDALLAHDPTADVFEPGERPANEATLRQWWRRTVTGPLDSERYWAWMGCSGRGPHPPQGAEPDDAVGDGLVEDVVHRERAAGLEPDDVDALETAFAHVARTASAVISESYTQSYVGALQALGGLNPKLLANMLAIGSGHRGRRPGVARLRDDRGTGIAHRRPGAAGPGGGAAAVATRPPDRSRRSATRSRARPAAGAAGPGAPAPVHPSALFSRPALVPRSATVAPTPPPTPEPAPTPTPPRRLPEPRPTVAPTPRRPIGAIVAILAMTALWASWRRRRPAPLTDVSPAPATTGEQAGQRVGPGERH
ncbi:MAG: protoglobin domain-containing protein [Acidimicrobiales bacterium]